MYSWFGWFIGLIIAIGISFLAAAEGASGWGLSVFTFCITFIFCMFGQWFGREYGRNR